MIADASHELRTPIAWLRANIQVLQEAERLPAHEQENLRRDVIEELDQLTALVGDVVELARGATGSEEPEDVRLDEVVAEALDRARDAGRCASRSSLTPTLVSGEASRIGRAISNLLDNACKWSAPQGVVGVELRDGVLTVRDHGPGFEPEDLPFVFDRFYRPIVPASCPARAWALQSCARRPRPTMDGSRPKTRREVERCSASASASRSPCRARSPRSSRRRRRGRVIGLLGLAAQRAQELVGLGREVCKQHAHVLEARSQLGVTNLDRQHRVLEAGQCALGAGNRAGCAVQEALHAAGRGPGVAGSNARLGSS